MQPLTEGVVQEMTDAAIVCWKTEVVQPKGGMLHRLSQFPLLIPCEQRGTFQVGEQILQVASAFVEKREIADRGRRGGRE
jgi:hypothetical protein